MIKKIASINTDNIGLYTYILEYITKSVNSKITIGGLKIVVNSFFLSLFFKDK